MKYQAPSNFRHTLLPEAFAEAAKLNPDHPVFFALDSDVPNAPVRTITYKRFLSDVAKVAKALQKSARASKREFGNGSEGLHRVGIYGRSSYPYFVHWIACLFNGWTVSSYLFSAIPTSFPLHDHYPMWSGMVRIMRPDRRLIMTFTPLYSPL